MTNKPKRLTEEIAPTLKTELLDTNKDKNKKLVLGTEKDKIDFKKD